MTRKKFWAVLAALALVTAAFAAPALARKGDGERGGGHGRGKDRPAQTRMRFRLDDHQLALGEAATGLVTLTTRDGRSWVPLEGATLRVVLKGDDSDDCDADCPNDDVVAPTAVTECATLTTDAEGHATVSCAAAAEGGYVVKVFYDGDETHKRSKRAQGFTVGAGDDDDDDDGDDEPVVDPTPTPTPTETTI